MAGSTIHYHSDNGAAMKAATRVALITAAAFLCTCLMKWLLTDSDDIRF
ncbi:MAG: hypothetical protein IJL32_14200 [Oscillospiraceae bacterium]|nr:hypothetical protein [Oscillospiraceae bacterium]